MSVLPARLVIVVVFLAMVLPASPGTGDDRTSNDPPLARVTPPDSALREPADGLITSREPGWPQWRGPRRDGISLERGLLPTWPEGGPKLRWQVDNLGTGWSSPIAVGERVFVTGDVGEDLVVFAFDRHGQQQWQSKNGKAWTGSFPGARSCCAYAAGRLYHLNAHGRLVCLDAATGQEQWAVDLVERFAAENITWAISECVLVDGPRVIVTPGGKQILMAALDRQTGETAWTTPSLDGEKTSYSSPILFQLAGRRLIANCSARHGFGVDADSGRLLWTVPLYNRFETNVATPIYGAGGIFFVTPYAEEGRLYRLRLQDESITVEQVWSSALDTVTGSGVLVDGTLYTAGYRKNKVWMGIDWLTGQAKYELSDFTTGAAIFADDRLYCLDETGKVGLLQPGPQGLKTNGQFRLPVDRVRDAWAHPVLCDGQLYLRYHSRLWCFDVKTP